MSEMLGNFYFHQRKFLSAQKQLECSIQNNPSDLAKKKLIICYTQSGLIDKSLELLYELIKKDIRLIASHSIKDENCPCKELIYEIENSSNFSVENYKYATVLGILWSYCDIKKSNEYFLKAIELNHNNLILKKVNEIISNYLIHYSYNKS